MSHLERDVQAVGEGRAYYVPAMRRRVYELPDTNDIAYAMAGKYGIYVALMAYAGLRAGEACAADLSWLDGNRLDEAERLSGDG